MAFKIKNGVLTDYIQKDDETDVFIPEGITEIQEQAFHLFPFCDKVESITISSSVRKIGCFAFVGCINLKYIYVDEKNQYFSSVDGILMNKEKTTVLRCPEARKSVRLPDTITEIGYRAFAFCKQLTDIEIPETVTKIDEWAFFCCKRLNNIFIPDSVERIETGAFYECGDIIVNCNDMPFRITVPESRNEGCDDRDNENLYNFIAEKDLSVREVLFAMNKKTAIKVQLAVFLILGYNNETAKAYLKKNIIRCVKRLTDMEKADMLTEVLKFGYVTKKNIDRLIQYAIDNRKYEIQIILSQFRQDNFGSAEDDFNKYFV